MTEATPRRLTPIEGFLCSIFDNNPQMEWSFQAHKTPVFLYKESLSVDAKIHHIDLRDYPDLFEALPNKVYRATAAARAKYLAAQRPI